MHPGDFIQGAGAKLDIIATLAKTIYKTTSITQLDGICDILTEGASSSKYPERLINKGNYMGALSAAFENACGVRNAAASQITRQKMVRFVKEYFPETIKLPDFEE